ncbi:metal-dependent transcriptional regulator [Mobilibacterium timonense]|uniref:metal-dependent transcriptional regulator n=1 Tax=Mobilibacterium timonense TaxID=1871012 RepID=UPI001F350DA1|nr:metal-dependent transcriptional regulator [Mobilibacterium timonense]
MTRSEQMKSIYRTFEDYLEAILIIKERQGYVRSTDVASQLGVSQPSVSYSVKRMMERGFLTRDQNNMLILTDEGSEIARRTYDRHKQLEKIFISIGVDPETAREDACNVEHDLSEKTFQLLCKHFGGDAKK